MRCEYKKIVQNIELTKEEAQTLYNAKEILQEARNNIIASCCEYDEDLMETIKSVISWLDICNARLNVNIIIETTEW